MHADAGELPAWSPGFYCTDSYDKPGDNKPGDRWKVTDPLFTEARIMFRLVTSVLSLLFLFFHPSIPARHSLSVAVLYSGTTNHRESVAASTFRKKVAGGTTRGHSLGWLWPLR